jgi:hypothetical protein
MPEVIIPPNAGNAILVWEELDTARQFSCTLGYSRVSSASVDPTVHADAVFGAVSGPSGPCVADQMNANYRFLSVRTYYNDAGTLVGGESTFAPISGSHIDSGTPAPNSIATIVRKHTGRVGRKYRGRMYVPCLKLPASFIATSGAIDPARVTSIQSNWSNAYNSLQDTGVLFPALLHDAAGPVTLLTSFEVASKIGIQRRRTA